MSDVDSPLGGSMRGSASILHEIISRADAMDIPASAREQFKHLVRQAGIAHGVAAMAHAEHIDYAGRLLKAGVSRATVRDRLMALFGISRRQAYRVIEDFFTCAN